MSEVLSNEELANWLQAQALTCPVLDPVGQEAAYRFSAAAGRLRSASPAVPDGWQTMDTAPKDGSSILVYHPEYGWDVAQWHKGTESAPDDPGMDAGWHGHHTHPGCKDFGFDPHAIPTHWKPLDIPAAPTPPREDYSDEVTDEQIARIKAHVGPINEAEWERVSPPAAPVAEREELAKELEQSRQGMKQVVIIPPATADKVIAALRSAPAVGEDGKNAWVPPGRNPNRPEDLP